MINFESNIIKKIKNAFTFFVYNGLFNVRNKLKNSIFLKKCQKNRKKMKKNEKNRKKMKKN